MFYFHELGFMEVGTSTCPLSTMSVFPCTRSLGHLVTIPLPVSGSKVPDRPISPSSEGLIRHSTLVFKIQ